MAPCPLCAPPPKGSTSAECEGQGLANVASALTGGMGGCALLGMSLVNIDSGGTARLAGVAFSAALAALALAAPAGPVVAAVPVPAVAGLMLSVAASTFSWSSLRLLGRARRADAAVLALVSVTTACRGLAPAVAAGTVLSSLAFAWDMSVRVAAPARDTASVHGYDAIMGRAGETARVFEVEGNVFFGSARPFRQLFAGEAAGAGPALVFLDFGRARVLDHSGVEAVANVCARLRALGKKVGAPPPRLGPPRRARSGPTGQELRRRNVELSPAPLFSPVLSPGRAP